MAKRKAKRRVRKPLPDPIEAAEFIQRLAKEMIFNFRIVERTQRQVICKWWALEFRFVCTNRKLHVAFIGNALDGSPVEGRSTFSNPPNIRNVAGFIRDVKEAYLKDVPPEVRKKPIPAAPAHPTRSKVSVRNPTPIKIQPAEKPTFDTEKEYLRTSWHPTDYG